jgi:hypothetical protein
MLDILSIASKKNIHLHPAKNKAPCSILAFLSAARMSQGAFCKLLYLSCHPHYNTIVKFLVILKDALLNA